jgi:hypothetical protein
LDKREQRLQRRDGVREFLLLIQAAFVTVPCGSQIGLDVLAIGS